GHPTHTAPHTLRRALGCWGVQTARGARCALSWRRRWRCPRRIDEIEEVRAHVRLRSIAIRQRREPETRLNQLEDRRVVVHRMRHIVFLAEWRDHDERHTITRVCEITRPGSQLP